MPLPLSRFAALLLAAVGSAVAHAGEQDDRTKLLAATRVEHGPTIDGRLDDPIWQTVRPERRFTQNFPDAGKPPTQRTDLYVVYDDQAIYFGLRCHDTGAAHIVERLTRRDRETDADRVSIDLDTRRDRSSAFHFDVNVAGVLVDGVRYNENEYNSDWDGLWRAAATRDGEGWSAEIEIPWRTLRFEGSDPVMGLQVRRTIQRRGEVDEWAWIPREVKSEVSRYGSLTGLHGLTPSRLFQVWPYVAARLVVRSNQGSLDGSLVEPAAGVDLKLGVTRSLTLDATINPDFGQVEADQVSLNLTTFELFFPEKRPFFLEGADLFSTPIRQFYTRRIGRRPVAPLLDSGESALESPTSGRIWAATKLSGQVVPHLSIAALDALTAEQTALVRTASGRAEARLVDPLTNFAVLRARADFGQSYLGAMATAVNRFEDRGDDTRPCPNDIPDLGDYLHPVRRRCTHDAYTVGLDGRLLTSDGTYGITAHGVLSVVENGPTRVVPDGARLQSGDTGFALSVNAGKQNGTLFYSVRYDGATPALDLNDAGFLRQANTHNLLLLAGLRRTRPFGPIAEISSNLYGYLRLDWGGVAQALAVGAEALAKFTNLWTLYATAAWDFNPVWDNRETRDGAFTERHYALEGGFDLKSDPRRKIVFEGWLFGNRVLRGASWFMQAQIGFRPLPQIELDVIPRLNWTYGDERWAYQTDDLGDGRRRYWFGELESQAFDVTLRGTYTFTPRLSLQLYTQVFVAGYHYSNFSTVTASGDRPFLRFADFRGAPALGLDNDSREGAINLNVVLRWEYLPGSTLIGVYTRSQGQVSYATTEGPGAPRFRYFSGGPATDLFLLKLSYLWG